MVEADLKLYGRSNEEYVRDNKVLYNWAEQEENNSWEQNLMAIFHWTWQSLKE